MASVEELILAAQARHQRPKSTIGTLLESAMTGYDQGVADREARFNTTLKLLQMQQIQQEMDAQQEMADEIKKQQEDNIRQELQMVGGSPKPVMPKQKFVQEISQDEKGRFSRKFKTVEPSQPKSLEEIAAGKVQGGELSLDEAYRMKEKPPAPDKSMSREITKAKVKLATTRPMVESVISEIDRVQKLNKDSYGGRIGQVQMKMRSGLEIGTESPKFKNTADTINTMQSQVAKVLKSTFGGQLSDGEREYLNGVYGALPSLSRSERDIAMTNVKKMLQAKLDGDKATLQELLDDAGIVEPAGDDTTVVKKSAEERFEELIASGKTEDEAYETLSEEGF